MPPCKHYDMCGLEAGYFRISNSPIPQSYFIGEFCILHADDPLKDKENFNSTFDVLLNAKKSLFSYIAFPSLDLAGKEFINDVSFNEAKFYEWVNFNGAKFNGTVSFKKAIFEKGAGFENAEFKSSVSFKESIINREINFKGVKFNRATFRKTKFNDEVNFINAQFRGRTDFREAEFKEISSFLGAEFFDKFTTFANVTFNNKAYFSNAIFEQGGVFRKIISNNELSFSNTIFKEDVDFTEVNIKGKLDFSYSKFNSNVDFSKSVFEGQITFNEVTFSKGAGFENVSFDGNTIFENINNNNPLDLTFNFSGSFFKEKVLFSSSETNKPMFRKSKLYFTNIKLTPPSALCFRNVDLQKAQLLDTDLSQAEFTKVNWAKLKGKDCIFDEKFYIEHFNLKKKDFPWEKFEKSYRALRTNYENIKDYVRASNLHFKEKDMMCKNPRMSWGNKILLIIYRYLSEYSEGVALPFLWSILLIEFCAILYLLGFYNYDFSKFFYYLNIKDFLKSLGYSIQIFFFIRPYGVDDFEKIILTNGISPIYTFERVLSPLLIGTFALSVRQRLKR